MVKKTKKQAFTIVELVIVIAVIAILAAIIIPTYSNLVKKANEATALVDAKNMITEMLADILSGDKDAADILVFSKKGNDVFLYGYDASRGVVLPYKVSPLKDFGKNLTVTDGHEFYKQAASFCKTIDGTDINIVTVNIDDWRKPEVLNLGINGEKSTVEELGFDKNTMAVFANYDIVPESFAKKNSGEEEVHTHVWATEWTKNSTHHWHDCTAEGCTVTVDSEKDGYGEHSWGDGVVTTEPTESTEGEKTFTCTACGATKTEKIPAIGHVCKDHLTHHDRVEATCTEKGNKEYWRCSGCGKYFTDEAGTTETTLEALTISAKGHTYKYTDNVDGSTHNVTCEKGDLTEYSENHDFDANGKCTKCGYEEKKTPVSKPTAEGFYIYKKGEYSYTKYDTSKTASGNSGAGKVEYYNANPTSYATFQEAVDAAEDGSLILINKDDTLTIPVRIQGKEVAFDLNGHTITSDCKNTQTWGGWDNGQYGAGIIKIESSSNVVILGTGVLKYTKTDNPSISVGGNSTLEIYSCTIEGAEIGDLVRNNASSGESRGVEIYNSTFNMYGGKITKHYSPDGGAGVKVDYAATFNLYDGEITENLGCYSGTESTSDGYSGGGVLIYDFSGGAVMNMYGGSILKNYCYTKNGQTDNGSTLSANHYVGGGISVERGTLNLNGGTISGNCATEGGAIAIFKNGTISGNKTTISDNTGWIDNSSQIVTVSKNSSGQLAFTAYEYGAN